MESSILTILPNLSIGVISVLSLVYITLKFITHLDERTVRHEKAMLEREIQIRSIEKEVRTTVLAQLSQNTEAMNDTARVMERVMNRLDS
jgi:hypothetical protein